MGGFEKQDRPTDGYQDDFDDRIRPMDYRLECEHSMTASWYCTDCETRIDTEEIDEHEAQGHHVKGAIRPDRLLGNDPWNMQVEFDGELNGTTPVREDGGES
jgi:hypothetical protein